MRIIQILLSALAISVATASRLPSFMRGVYLLLADTEESVKTSSGSVPSTGNWQPKISSWIHEYNVVFFTFINSDMKVPQSFENARTSGQFQAGTKIVYSIGGYSYSANVKAWKNTFSNPKQLASEVAQWKCDGIDIDIETGAGGDVAFSTNLLIFTKELRRLRNDMIITMAVFGYPQVFSQSLIVVNSWKVDGTFNNLIDSVGIMVYDDTQSLKWVGQYTGESCTPGWCALCSNANVGTPCSKVAKKQVIGGLGGNASQQNVNTLCSSGTGGYMVWYASADNGFQYEKDVDARGKGINWTCNQKVHHQHSHNHHHNTTA